MSSSSSAFVGFCPRPLSTAPNSLADIVPSPSLSNSANASLNSEMRTTCKLTPLRQTSKAYFVITMLFKLKCMNFLILFRYPEQTIVLSSLHMGRFELPMTLAPHRLQYNPKYMSISLRAGYERGRVTAVFYMVTGC